MPKGMMLKSDGFASSLSAPEGSHTLKDYCARNGIAYADTAMPVPLEAFNDYALDFQRRFVPSLDQRSIASIAKKEQGFELRLDDGELVAARKVVVAVGVTHFAYVPEVLSNFGPQHVSHSSAHREMERFRNCDVTVIGAGSSAIDIAALLLESGARVTIVARAKKIKYSSKPGRKSLWYKIRHPPSGLGPGLRSRIFCDWPHLFRFLPASLRFAILRRHLGPFSLWYMESRVSKANLVQGFEIDSANLQGNRIVLNMRRDGEAVRKIESDHVIAATGYRVDLNRLPFMDEKFRSRIHRTGPMPTLSGNFESSVEGLYFVGLAAAGGFGPLMRFMYGADFTARRIGQHLVGKS
jgi:hypothetical protein